MGSYLITGGAGFIGANYVRHVLANTDHQVTVLDKLTYAASKASIDSLPADRVTFVQGDVCDADLVDRLVTDAVRSVTGGVAIDLMNQQPGLWYLVEFARDSDVMKFMGY